jgi:uncharacterized membrane protein (DUF485 family)
MSVSPLSSPAMRRKVLVNFGLFLLFFIFYLLAAVVQTPSFKEFAAIPVVGMPMGMLLSLLIFPISWLIMAIWFWRSK